jgi:HSP20 family protein
MTSTLTSPRLMPVDLYREGDTYRLDADLPGVDPQSVDIDVDGQLLTIRAERAASAPDDAKWLARGRQSGAFIRRFTLGQGIDSASIAASYDNGVLSLSIPVTEKAKPRKIEVTSGVTSASDNAVAQETVAA